MVDLPIAPSKPVSDDESLVLGPTNSVKYRRASLLAEYVLPGMRLGSCAHFFGESLRTIVRTVSTKCDRLVNQDMQPTPVTQRRLVGGLV